MFGINHIRNSKISKISGGELKRVSIASEVMLGRALLGLDEPTTGLSAKESLCVIQALKNLTSQKISVVASIHQPRSDVLRMFDFILVLNKGRILFYGKREDLLPYFLKLAKKQVIKEGTNIEDVNQDEIVGK